MVKCKLLLIVKLFLESLLPQTVQVYLMNLFFSLLSVTYELDSQMT